MHVLHAYVLLVTRNEMAITLWVERSPPLVVGRLEGAHTGTYLCGGLYPYSYNIQVYWYDIIVSF